MLPLQDAGIRPGIMVDQRGYRYSPHTGSAVSVYLRWIRYRWVAILRTADSFEPLDHELLNRFGPSLEDQFELATQFGQECERDVMVISPHDHR